MYVKLFLLDKLSVVGIESSVSRRCDEQGLCWVKTSNALQFAIFREEIGNHACSLCAQAESNDVNIVESEQLSVEQKIDEIRCAICDSLQVSNGVNVARTRCEIHVVDGDDVKVVTFEKCCSKLGIGMVVAMSRIAVNDDDERTIRKENCCVELMQIELQR